MVGAQHYSNNGRTLEEDLFQLPVVQSKSVMSSGPIELSGSLEPPRRERESALNNSRVESAKIFVAPRPRAKITQPPPQHRAHTVYTEFARTSCERGGVVSHVHSHGAKGR